MWSGWTIGSKLLSPRSFTYAIGTLLLISTAIYNGYPLVYIDSGAYLRSFIEYHNLPDRPIYYGIFLGLLHRRLSLWPVVVGQALAVTFVVERTISCCLPRASVMFTAGVLAFLTIATSLPWFTGQLMPYVFTPMLVLVIYLVTVERSRLGRWDYCLLLLMLCAIETMHYTHIALALGLFLVLYVASLIVSVVRARDLVPMILATAIATGAIYAVNYAERREIVFGPYNSILLFDRLLEYGTAQQYLARACPTRHYEICPYLDDLKRLPPRFGEFMWSDTSILAKLGGQEHYRHEAGALVRDIVMDAPLEHLWLALGGAARLVVNFPTGAEFATLGEGTQIYRVISLYFPWEMNAYLHSKEYRGTLRFEIVNAVDIPVGFVSMLTVVGLVPLAIVAGDVQLSILLSLAIAALMGNAFLCGGLSSGDAHYQSRLIPLFALTAVVGLFRLRSQRLAGRAGATTTACPTANRPPSSASGQR